jgi:hypothetical protein
MKSEGNDLRPRTKAYARQIIMLFAKLPRATASQVLGKQMLGSGTAVGANYRDDLKKFKRPIIPFLHS